MSGLGGWIFDAFGEFLDVEYLKVFSVCRHRIKESNRRDARDKGHSNSNFNAVAKEVFLENAILSPANTEAFGYDFNGASQNRLRFV